MKFILGILLGVIAGATVATIGSNARWRMDAWEHHAAVYYTYDIINHPDLEWSWSDDYFNLRTQLIQDTTNGNRH